MDTDGRRAFLLLQKEFLVAPHPLDRNGIHRDMRAGKPLDALQYDAVHQHGPDAILRFEFGDFGAECRVEQHIPAFEPLVQAVEREGAEVRQFLDGIAHHVIAVLDVFADRDHIAGLRCRH